MRTSEDDQRISRLCSLLLTRCVFVMGLLARALIAPNGNLFTWIASRALFVSSASALLACSECDGACSLSVAFPSGLSSGLTVDEVTTRFESSYALVGEDWSSSIETSRLQKSEFPLWGVNLSAEFFFLDGELMSVRVYDSYPVEVRALVEKQYGIEFESLTGSYPVDGQPDPRFNSKHVSVGVGVSVRCGYDFERGAGVFVEWFDDCRWEKRLCLAIETDD